MTHETHLVESHCVEDREQVVTHCADGVFGGIARLVRQTVSLEIHGDCAKA
jgi:hypothetical protein